MYVLGVDVGTTGTKAILADDKGTLVGRSYKGYPLITLADGGLEQCASDWWLTFIDTVREATACIADKNEILALSLSTQGGSCVLLDGAGEPLANAHTWMDTRPASVLDAFADTDHDRFYELSGWRLNGAMMAARAVWYKRNHPDIWAKAKMYLTTVDYINLRLTGCAVIDPTNAAMTQLFDIRKMDWDDATLAASGVSRAVLPTITPSGETLGTLLPEAAKILGLTEKTLVVSGAHDQYAAAVGACAYEPGDIVLSTGTAWVLLGITDKLTYDFVDYLGVGNHALEGLFSVLTSIPTGGVGLEWCKKNFAESKLVDGAVTKVTFDKINEVAQTRVKQNSKLLFYPQFSGCGFPRWKTDNKASFIGLSLEHDSYDMALAIMEGVAFDVAIIIEAYAAKGFSCHQLKMLGGASKSRLWTNIVRNVTGLPLTRFHEADVACLGAAAFSAAACGVFPSIRCAAQALARDNMETLEVPSGELREHYADKFEFYKKRLPNIDLLYQKP